MPTLNDFGPQAYARAEQAIRDFAGRLGIQPEIITQYVNATAHLPQNLDELRAWGRTPNPNYPAFTPMNPDGTWNVLRPGDTPGTMGAKDPGFRHVITNEVDKLQRFLQVNPDGTLFAGSWDPAYNAAHPELGRFANAYEQMAAGAATGATQTAQGGLSRSAAGMDPGNYVAPSRNGGGMYESVVGGVPVDFPTQGAAEDNFNQRTGGGSTSAPATSAPAASGGYSGGGDAATAGGGGFGGNVGINTGLLDPAINLANNAAQQAYNQKRLELDRDIANMQNDRQKDQIALQAARDAWNKTYQTATLTGTINGQPTLDAAKQQADITGYTGTGYASQAQAAFNNLPPEQRTGDAAARIWQSIVPGLTADEAAAMNEAGHQYYAATGQVMPDAVAAQQLSRITGGRISGQGTPTLAREQEQNRTLTSVLGLLANLRGPENAFAYANTLASIPDSIKAQIQAAMGRTGVAPRTPAQAGVLGDLGVPQTAPAGVGATQFGGNAAVDQGPQPGAAAANGGVQTGTPAMTYQGPPLAGMPPAAAEDPNARMTLFSAAPAADQMQRIQPTLLQHLPVQSRPLGAGPTQAGSPVLQRGLLPQAGVTATGMTPANQISPTDYNRTGSYGRSLLWAGYENRGADKQEAMDQYLRSLPAQSGPRVGRYRGP